MENIKKNRAFIVDYFNAISGKAKTEALLEKYMTDTALRDHITFFEGAFPNYELLIEEMISEGEKVIVRGRCLGEHKNEFNGIPPTNKNMDLPFVIRYTIENGKISDHWLIADQLTLMEQLGVMQSST
jgi:predicted ester cyclase